MADAKAVGAFRTISEVSDDIGVPQHVLRFWETKFPAIKPMKRGGNRRYYRPEDIQLLQAINRLLYTDGYTIKGVQKLIKDRGTRAVIGVGGEGAPVPPPAAPSDLFVSEQPVEVSAFGASQVVELRAIRDRLAAALQQSLAA
ncbi:MerR family transcriptional regulator [Sphingoaurantiacus capsulatus]|uniref:MerR family transcriptional regulator n=1 Tax=Sphingoaurantiacus capsulatus TaxID=1771310 RepID=A0ABV7XCC1_9SPHN